MKPIIYLALTDDWELRGNGSGDIRRIQFRPMKELIRIYDKYGVRGTFNAEVMQQLTFRKFQGRFPELGPLADEWDAHVREAFLGRHDIQLHLHSQWATAEYENGEWRLSGDWSLLNYDASAAYGMLESCKEYLETLLQPIDKSYRCVSFRAGSSSVAPSEHLLKSLARLGIVFDMSIIGGLYHDTANIHIDYRNCEESFLPFYPYMEDARKLSNRIEDIISVPIQYFHSSRGEAAKQILSTGFKKARRRVYPTLRSNNSGGPPEGNIKNEWEEKRHSSGIRRIYEKAVVPCLKGKHMTSDVGKLTLPLLREMVATIRDKARSSGLTEVPAILTNHTKYIEDFATIDRFLAEASSASDIRFLTLSELAAKLRRGEFYIRKAERADN